MASHHFILINVLSSICFVSLCYIWLVVSMYSLPPVCVIFNQYNSIIWSVVIMLSLSSVCMVCHQLCQTTHTIERSYIPIKDRTHWWLIWAFSDFKAFLYILIGGLKPPIKIYKKALKSKGPIKIYKKALKSEKARISHQCVRSFIGMYDLSIVCVVWHQYV